MTTSITNISDEAENSGKKINESEQQGKEPPFFELTHEVNDKVVSIDEKPSKKPAADTTLVFEAYAKAFEETGRIKPRRSARVNAQLKQMIKDYGLEESILIASRYPHHKDAWHVKTGHSVGVMVSQAENLRQQIHANKMMTSAEARKIEEEEVARQEFYKDEYFL